jgi:hypothetical protein
MEGNYTKEVVCKACLSIGIEYLDCVCTYMNNYPTVELEFKECSCCKHVDDSEVPDTKFNRQQLGNEYFDWKLE